MSDHDLYQTPLVGRYASRAMSELFGARRRILTWRKVWLALAEAQRRAGLNISPAQIEQLTNTLDQIDFAAAVRHEQRLRHDVMAHVHAWGDVAPEARAILHLGATSADITDNADLIILRDALRLIAQWLANAIDALATFAEARCDLPTLGFTHFQPAQATTVGKRAALWCYDFVRDLDEVEVRIAALRFRGLHGATGTQASFLALCNGDVAKVKQIETDVARRFDFDRVEPVTGQTYSRKVDAQAVGALAGVAASVHKFANDVRLLAGLGELEEPFEAEQVGSSAMPYKRNPMRCERATGLARFVISLANSPLQTAAEQWLERTLDDSANKRIAIAEAFLATDAMLRLITNVSRGLVVYPKVIEVRLRAELPFLAVENILLAATSAGGDRQELHERLRRHCRAAADRMKTQGSPNDLLARLRADPSFTHVDLSETRVDGSEINVDLSDTHVDGSVELNDASAVLNPARYIGLAPQQVNDFLAEFVTPIRRRYAAALNRDSTLSV